MAYIFLDSMVAHSSKMVANVHERTSFDEWHKRLEHPLSKIVHNLIKIFSLPVNKKKYLSALGSLCFINKTHALLQVFKVMYLLILFILMFMDLHIFLELMVLVTTLFWWIITPNICDSIQWS